MPRAGPSSDFQQKPLTQEGRLSGLFCFLSKFHTPSVVEYSRPLLASGENPPVLLLALSSCHPAHCPGASLAAHALQESWRDLNLDGPFLFILVSPPPP